MSVRRGARVGFIWFMHVGLRWRALGLVRARRHGLEHVYATLALALLSTVAFYILQGF